MRFAFLRHAAARFSELRFLLGGKLVLVAGTLLLLTAAVLLMLLVLPMALLRLAEALLGATLLLRLALARLLTRPRAFVI